MLNRLNYHGYYFWCLILNDFACSEIKITLHAALCSSHDYYFFNRTSQFFQYMWRTLCWKSCHCILNLSQFNCCVIVFASNSLTILLRKFVNNFPKLFHLLIHNRASPLDYTFTDGVLCYQLFISQMVELCSLFWNILHFFSANHRSLSIIVLQISHMDYSTSYPSLLFSLQYQ